ncbi:MAG: hypothetical protein CL912_32700 [Deltaproteobacteria bacterium]|nr:hypothetical protein [Deltaproteobacteria bacterium]
MEEIRRQIEGISRHGDSPAEYAAWIVNGGRARIFLKEDDPDGGTRVVHLREPVAQFWHRHAEYPAFVLEVSYSQDGKDPKGLAWDYIQYSMGISKWSLVFRCGRSGTSSGNRFGGSYRVWTFATAMSAGYQKLISCRK